MRVVCSSHTFPGNVRTRKNQDECDGGSFDTPGGGGDKICVQNFSREPDGKPREM
jgi:hypothetical protein